MKKDFLKLTAVLSSIAIIGISLIAIRFFAGDEDSWICVNGEWIKHGNPSVSKPQTGCGEEKQIISPSPVISVTITSTK